VVNIFQKPVAATPKMPRKYCAWLCDFCNFKEEKIRFIRDHERRCIVKLRRQANPGVSDFRPPYPDDNERPKDSGNLRRTPPSGDVKVCLVKE
jgi:hypothetical protein